MKLTWYLFAYYEQKLLQSIIIYSAEWLIIQWVSYEINHYLGKVYEIMSFFLIVYIMRIKENTFSYSFRMLNVLHLHYSNLIYLYKKLIDRYNIYFPFLFCEYYLYAKHHFISHVFFFSFLTLFLNTTVCVVHSWPRYSIICL